MDVDRFFAALVQLAEELNEEEQRHVVEQLSKEELTLFDLLTKPDIKMSKNERELAKRVARDLQRTLKEKKLVLDWPKTQQMRASVHVTIEEELDRLPETRLVMRKGRCRSLIQTNR